MAKVAIDKIKIDESIYPRTGVNEFNVGRLVSALKTGVKLPPLLIEAKTHRLVDGRHRLQAFLKLKIERIDVVEKVYASEADLYADAVRANIGHGEPLDQFSIRSAIIRLEQYGCRLR
jgi:ParB-like chromosome segregation protein Spo0J